MRRPHPSLLILLIIVMGLITSCSSSSNEAVDSSENEIPSTQQSFCSQTDAFCVSFPTPVDASVVSHLLNGPGYAEVNWDCKFREELAKPGAPKQFCKRALPSYSVSIATNVSPTTSLNDYDKLNGSCVGPTRSTKFFSPLNATEGLKVGCQDKDETETWYWRQANKVYTATATRSFHQSAAAKQFLKSFELMKEPELAPIGDPRPQDDPYSPPATSPPPMQTTTAPPPPSTTTIPN